ncbi:MAG: pseudouridine synthase [Cryomorphaceae bacterium BACL11 MAG-121128-bin16]|jgi:tRNA pseudouridine38-40 synthase|nr:MAG: pseudouridine synthase [Cryomorphaceae bacterium BACL11 MAG-121128-bin16]
MRFFIELSYKGTNYHGWQEQPNANTVQAEINRALSTILNTNIEVIGAGRTDTGVHANQMFAHFDCDIDFDIQNLMFKLNSFLASDIAIKDIFKVKEDANCRFDALSRTYQYHIIQKKDPFNKTAYFLQNDLDIKAMNEACKYIIGKQDFTSFSKVNTQTFTNNCDVMFAKWELVNNKIIFTIKADRFLRNMVRAIVGTLLDVGFGKIIAADVAKIIAAKDRSKSGVSVPAHALFLTEVKYPNKIRT